MGLLLELLADLIVNLGIAALPRRAQIGCLLAGLLFIVLLFGWIWYVS